MDIDKIELNRTIQMLMRHMHDSQTSIGRVIGLSQPQVGFRLRAPDDPKQIDWAFLELAAIAKHWGIPLTTLCSGRTVALQWVTDNVIDMRDPAIRTRTCGFFDGSQDPLPFPQDDDDFLIDLREHILNQTAQNDSLVLYADAS